MQSFQCLIDGALVEGGAGTVSVINPATGAPFASCGYASMAQLDSAVAAAGAAFPKWSELAVLERAKVLARIADAIELHAEELARLLTQEQGKPLAESRFEIIGTVAYLRFYADYKLPLKVLEDSDARFVEQRRRPLGVVAAIVPWNYPLLLLAGKIAPALLAGNTVVAKPAPTTPVTTLRFAVLLVDIVPAGVVNVIADNGDLGAALCSHPGVRKVSFTGSTATGSKVMASAASTLKRITLELGGNDAGIVLDDVDPTVAAEQLFNVAFANNGQICVALKRVYVHDRVYDAVCDALATIADTVVVGNGLEPGTRLGPLQNERQREIVESLVADARRHGKVIAGGERVDGPGFFFRPTIVRDINDGTRLVDEEQFGPVLPVIRFSDVADAIRGANSSSYGLGGSVWSADYERAMAIAGKLDAGTVWINKHMDAGPHIPLAGAKLSGIGVEYGEEGIAEYTQLQIINATKQPGR